MVSASVVSAFNELLEHLEQQEHNPERRAWPRYAVHGPVTVEVVNDAQGAPASATSKRAGWALELSRGGMSVSVPRTARLGT
jgi:hypothetical protein